MANIKFLHLSDLHIGDKYQKGLMSQTKKVVFEDIEYILGKLESVDIVFFTGDLVQKGTQEEFVLVEEFLIDLWKLFEKYGQNPYLFCVPGNHDLERISDLNNPIQKVLTNWTQENIKDDYFWNAPNDYHDFIKERFKNYTEWYKNTSIKKPDIVEGYIPGDFYCSLNLNNINIGVVGLNSTFLQLHGGDVKKKLGVYVKQVNSLFGEKYFEWLSKQDVPILLTHQSPEWFEPKSFNEFNQEIYSLDSYVEHLCGHMHEPSYTSTSINGFPSKRIFISPSLFGLEYYENNSSSRIHGYTAGIYSIDSGTISKTIWPRISIQTSSGLKISQNEEFNLEKGSSSFTNVLKNSQRISVNNNLSTGIEKLDSINKGENLFAKDTILDKGLARTIYKEYYSHLSIRFQERNLAVKNLKEKNYCWIATTFGLGEDEFIGSILNESNINPENCFSINCDEVFTLEELIEVFKSTFSQNITQFFDIISSLNRPLIVFNHLNDDFIKETAILKEFIQTIFDFSPYLKIIFVTEASLESRFFDFIELTPLDIPAVKHYLEKSQELQSSFTFLEYEKIHRISSGIPLYIDKVIVQLKFRPLSDLGDMEFETSSNENTNNILPKTLINEINIIRTDESKQGCRRYKLLSTLSLLHSGETFERIRKYDSNLPFYADDISYLLNNKLIETVQVNSIFKEIIIDSELIKIIRVPRVIRDYISSLLSDDEKVDTYKKACNLYLGNNWRTSIKLVQPKGAELDLIVHQNLQIAIRFILLYGVEKENEVEANRMIRISMALITYFSERGAYKDAASLTEETLLLIKDVNFKNIETTRTYLMKKLGENLRMSSIHDRSVSILKSICDDESNSLSKKDRNDIRLSLAYAYENQDSKEEAVRYANLIKQNEGNKNSAVFLSAESIITNFIEDDSERLRKLKSIKNKAERLGFNTLKANIIFDICKNTKDESQLKLMDKIIVESKDDTYNKVRALVVKAEIILNIKSIDKITDEDLLGLNISYSYSFYQRLQALLNKCHNLAWKYWSKQNRFDQLLNLFRYSSFVWRLCGEISQEQKYIDKLHLNPEFIEWFKSNKNGISSAYYEQRIFALYSNGKSDNMIE